METVSATVWWILHSWGCVLFSVSQAGMLSFIPILVLYYDRSLGGYAAVEAGPGALL